MFDNIGGKIKGLATVICWFGIIGSVIGGISLFSYNFLLGTVVGMAGTFCSWISSFFMYGFGELVQKTAGVYALLDAQFRGEFDEDDAEEQEHLPPIVSASTCPHCGAACSPSAKFCVFCGTTVRNFSERP